MIEGLTHVLAWVAVGGAVIAAIIAFGPFFNGRGPSAGYLAMFLTGISGGTAVVAAILLAIVTLFR